MLENVRRRKQTNIQNVRHSQEMLLQHILRTSEIHPRTLVEMGLIDFDRLTYILEKWEAKGIWDSGTSIYGGWFTHK